MRHIGEFVPRSGLHNDDRLTQEYPRFYLAEARATEIAETTGVPYMPSRNGDDERTWKKFVARYKDVASTLLHDRGAIAEPANVVRRMRGVA